MSTLSGLLRSRWPVAAALAVATLTAAACGSSGGGGAGGGTSSSSAAQAVVVDEHSGPAGAFLTDSSGKALYMFASDSGTKSTCVGQCLQYWPIFKGTPKAGTGIQQAKLGTIRTNGAEQVTYAGHPLYYFSGDSGPGQTNGEGSNNFGAKWWLLAPSGQPITTSAGTSPSPAGSSSNNPYNYGNG